MREIKKNKEKYIDLAKVNQKEKGKEVTVKDKQTMMKKCQRNEIDIKGEEILNYY